MAPSEWKTATFEGSKLKPNSSIAMGDGLVKLIVLDLDEGPPDVRFRMTTTSRWPKEAPISGARLTLIDSQGKVSASSSQGGGYSSDGTTFEHRIQFRGSNPVAADSLRTLRLEVPMPKGPSKEVRFRIPNAPVLESNQKRKGKQ